MEEKKPTNQAIFRDVLDEYKAAEGMSYAEIKNGIATEYERRVKAYQGADYPCYEGEGGTPQQKANREAFKLKMQSQGRLPKE